MQVIKKIKLQTVCDFLEIDLMKNTIAIGWDVSMHSTGIAIIRTTNNYLVLEQIEKIQIPKDIQNLDAMDLFIEQLNRFADKVSQKFKIDINIIEDCFFSKCARTLKSLARHSVLVYDRFRGISRKSFLIMGMLPCTIPKNTGGKAVGLSRKLPFNRPWPEHAWSCAWPG